MPHINVQDQPYLSGLNYAEGWLSIDRHSNAWEASWEGARYAGFTGINRIAVAKAIFRDLKRRGLKPGFDLDSLGKH